MRNNPIGIADIQKRQQRVASSNTDKAAITEAAIDITKDESNRDTMIERLFTLCCNTENAEKYMPYLVKFMDEAHIYSAHSNALVSCFVENIAPAIEDVNKAIAEISKIKNDKLRCTLMEAVNNNVTIDKIIDNHNKISKRFNVDAYTLEHAFYMDPVDVSNQICEWIDTYNMPGYAKLQTVVEETGYMLQKCGAKYDRNDVLRSVVEYFLINGTVTGDEAKRVLESSKVISEADTSEVRYLFNEYTSDEISTAIQKCKKEELTESKFNKVMNSIYTKSPEQIVDGTPNILAWIRQIIVLSTLGINIIVGAVIILIDKLVQMNINRKQVEKVTKVIKSEQEKTKKALASAEGTKKDRLEKYSNGLDKAIDQLNVYNDKH